jgi:hypothetical protein
MGPEVAVGMLIAWVIAKARQAGKQFNGVADQVVDAAANGFATCCWVNSGAIQR